MLNKLMLAIVIIVTLVIVIVFVRVFEGKQEKRTVTNMRRKGIIERISGNT